MKQITTAFLLLIFFCYVNCSQAQQIPIAPVDSGAIPMVLGSSSDQGNVSVNKKKKQKVKKVKTKKTKTKKVSKSKNVKSKHSAQLSLKIQ